MPGFVGFSKLARGGDKGDNKKPNPFAKKASSKATMKKAVKGKK